MNTKKFFFICSAIVAIGCVCFGAGIALGGSVYGITLSQKGVEVESAEGEGSEKYEGEPVVTGHVSEKIDLEAFDSIELKVSFSDCRIIQSDHYGIEYNVPGKGAPKVQVKNGVLSVESKSSKDDRWEFKLFSLGKNPFSKAFMPTIYIYVPKDMKGKELKINLSSGSVKLDDVYFKEVDINNSFGNLEFDNFEFEDLKVDINSGSIEGNQLKGKKVKLDSSFGNAEVKKVDVKEVIMQFSTGNIEIGEIISDRSDIGCSYGAIEIDGIKSGIVNMKNSSGAIELSRVDADDIDASCSFGEISIELLNIDEYNMDCKADFGEVSIGGKSKGGSYTISDSSKKKKLKAKCSYGEVALK